MKVQKLFVAESNAASMLDLPRADFLRGVAQGDLPQPIVLAGVQRWCVDDLRALASGQLSRPTRDIEV